MEDNEIIGLYWERSESAVSETDAKYKKLCLHVADNILSDRSDSEECLNDTYLAVWNSIPSERPRYFPAFLCRIIRNLALKRYRYNTAGKRNPEVTVSMDELEECVPSGENVERICDARELGRLISDFLRGQSRKNRVIFVRRYWYYDSVKEIAERYSLSENSVKQSLFRMREKLKRFLSEEGL
jgi:RNA polymerase sigma-70 factor (ECF subfamily)